MKNVDIVEYFQTSYDNDDKILLKSFYFNPKTKINTFFNETVNELIFTYFSIQKVLCFFFDLYLLGTIQVCVLFFCFFCKPFTMKCPFRLTKSERKHARFIPVLFSRSFHNTDSYLRTHHTHIRRHTLYSCKRSYCQYSLLFLG